jgi:hypothetical protein
MLAAKAAIDETNNLLSFVIRTFLISSLDEEGPRAEIMQSTVFAT